MSDRRCEPAQEIALHVHSRWLFLAIGMFLSSFAVTPSWGTEPEVLRAPQPSEPSASARPEADLLVRAAIANQDLYVRLESFVCREQIERFAGRVASEAGKHVDSITAKVSMESGIEHYSDLYRKNRPLRDMANLEGAWSEGEFGTLVKQTEQLLRTQQPRFQLWDQVNGSLAGVYSFDVATSESPWTLNVGGQRYSLPFTNTVWISHDSGEILRIARVATNLPSGLHIDQITWGITLDRVDLNGMRWLLPSRGEYQVSYRPGNRVEWNSMTFSDYHHYGSEVALHFN